MIIHRDIEQGSTEWHEMRLGYVTASRFKDVLAGGKGLTRNAYMMQLAAEFLTGQKEESYSNSAMEWGTATEPQARSMYELNNMLDVEQVTFITHDDIKAGYSPDGLVNDNGLVEIKCPKTTTHIETVLSGKMPTGHIPQVQGGLWISEREWLDFVSFDPRINSNKSFFCVRVYRDDEYIKNLESEIIRFNNDLHDLIYKLK
jgi:putative phage-type endonuclease